VCLAGDALPPQTGPDAWTLIRAPVIAISTRLVSVKPSPGLAATDIFASLLASNFPEARQIEVEALMYAAMALLAITLVVNVLGSAILMLTSKQEVN
jgi:ABC-type phosphate transport system permease subunit